MRKIFFFLFLVGSSFGAILENLTSFEADFSQTIHNQEEKVVTYEGHVVAAKPQYARWDYTKPIQKSVYIDNHSVVVIEPELEQAIIRKIHDDFDIFTLLKNAKKIAKNSYEAHYKETTFIIQYNGKDIEQLRYNDNFDNEVVIKFTHQKYNKKIDPSIFKPDIPDEYDMIIE